MTRALQSQFGKGGGGVKGWAGSGSLSRKQAQHDFLPLPTPAPPHPLVVTLVFYLISHSSSLRPFVQERIPCPPPLPLPIPPTPFLFSAISCSSLFTIQQNIWTLGPKIPSNEKPSSPEHKPVWFDVQAECRLLSYLYCVINTTAHLAVYPSAQKQKTFGLFSLPKCVMKKLSYCDQAGRWSRSSHNTCLFTAYKLKANNINTLTVYQFRVCVILLYYFKNLTPYMLKHMEASFKAGSFWRILCHTKNTHFKGCSPLIGTQPLYHKNWIPDWCCDCVLIFFFFQSGWPIEALHQKTKQNQKKLHFF